MCKHKLKSEREFVREKKRAEDVESESKSESEGEKDRERRK